MDRLAGAPRLRLRVAQARNFRVARYTHALMPTCFRGLAMTALLPLCVACGATHASPPVAATPASPAGGSRVDLPRVVVTPDGSTDLPSLMEEARAARARGELKQAAERYERAAELDQEGAFAPEALHEAGMARDDAGELAIAQQRFEQLAQRFPDHPLARDALLRAMRIACHLDRFARAGQLADLVLARYGDLRPFELVLTHSAKALAELERGDRARASYHVEKGRDAVENNGLDRAGQIPRDLALLYFALGEIRRLAGEDIVFDPRPPDFATTLERRCQLLLDAQAAYSDAMRAYDAHWSTMAGFRVGELYQRLHRDLLRTPLPELAGDPARRNLFEGAMRLRYSVLLDKGLDMIAHTLAQASRNQERSGWVARAAEAKVALERARDEEARALDRLPYSRAQLEEALADLAARKGTTPEKAHPK